MKTKSQTLRNLIFVVLLAMSSAELLVRPTFGTVDLSDSTRAVNRILKSFPAGVVTELPVVYDIDFGYATPIRQLRAIDDDKPRDVGYSGFVAFDINRRQAIANGFPDPRAIALLQAEDVHYVILHGAKTKCDGKYSFDQLNQIQTKVAQIPGTQQQRINNDVLIVLPSIRIPIDHNYTFPPNISNGNTCPVY